MGAALDEQWGGDAVKKFEIVPLTRRNIKEAVRAEGIDVTAFLSQVSNRGVGPLAAKPVTPAKGCWKADLKGAMETQPVNRYLRENSCQHGLYLVGWYGCSQWHHSDHRKDGTPFSSIEEASEYLADQAKALSAEGIHIEALVIDASLR